MGDQDFDAAMGRSVRDMREHRGLTGTQFAQQWEAASGIARTQQTVSDLESGRRKLKLEEWLQVAYCLDTSPTSLLTHAHALRAFSVGGLMPDYEQFRDWVFETQPLPGQDKGWFRAHATVNLIGINDVWTFIGDLYTDFDLAIMAFETAVGQKQLNVIKHTAGVVRQRLLALEQHLVSSLTR